MKKCLFTVAIILIAISSVCAKDTQTMQISKKATVQVLTKSSTSWDGKAVSYAPGSAEIQIMKIHIPSGVQLPLHCHPTPLAAYMTKGTLEVTKKSGEKSIFHAGEAFIEVMNSWHFGRSIDTDAELIVFYAGTKGIPITVKENGDPALAKKCQ